MEKVKIRLHEIAGIIAVTTLLVVLFFSMTAHAADGSGTYTDGYGVTWKYSVSDQEVSILGCDNIPESGEIHIPAAIDGTPVKLIEARAFQNNGSIRISVYSHIPSRRSSLVDDIDYLLQCPGKPDPFLLFC